MIGRFRTGYCSFTPSTHGYDKSLITVNLQLQRDDTRRLTIHEDWRYTKIDDTRRLTIHED